ATVKEIQRPSTFLDSTNPTVHSAQVKQETYQLSTNSRRALSDITNQQGIIIQQHVSNPSKKGPVSVQHQCKAENFTSITGAPPVAESSAVFSSMLCMEVEEVIAQETMS
ncbi:Cysteine--tRNA ligase, partial [Frankliniella fusca]